MIQQGDVLIKKISHLPSNLKKVERKIVGGNKPRFILAEGETTGHAHAICEDVGLFIDETGNLFMSSDKQVIVEHEEHGNVEVSAGTFKIDIVQEYDHFAEEARKVAD